VATTFSRTTIVLLIILVSFVPVHASQIIDTIDPLLKAGEFEKAQGMIDGYLADDPKSVDAYMMLGNLKFYEYMSSVPQIELASNMDESVFVTGIGSIREAIVTVPGEVGAEVAGHLEKALSLDSTRGDIHRGLAYVLAMAMMKDELVSHFRRMKKSLPDDDGLPYDMSSYAGMLKDRGRPDWSQEVYGEILSLYPGNAGVLSDSARTYFENGQTVKAAATVSRTLNGNDVNAKILSSGMLILVVAGDYSGGLSAAKLMSQHQGNSIYLVYRGLMKYAQGKQEWRKDLESFMESDTAGQEQALVAHLLNSDYTGSLDYFIKSDQVAESIWSRILLYRAAMLRLPKEAAPYLNYAIIMSAYENYPEALPAFARAQELYGTLTDELKEAFNLFYGWTLQDSGRIDDANRRWKTLLGVDTFYAASAAAWFLGRNLYESGKRDEAFEMFLTISDRASESKYATYARNAVNAINDGREPAFAKK